MIAAQFPEDLGRGLMGLESLGRAQGAAHGLEVEVVLWHRPQIRRLFGKHRLHSGLEVEFFPQLGRNGDLEFAADRGLHGEN